MNWINQEILPKNAYGFTYKITYDYDDKEYTYYGKKSVVSELTKEMRKDGKKRQGHIRFLNRMVVMTPEEKLARSKQQVANRVKTKKVAFEEYTVEAKNWKSYVGSSKVIPKEAVITKKEIISVAYGKKQIGYLETKLLFAMDVLEDPLCFNENIMGRYYKEEAQEWM